MARVHAFPLKEDETLMLYVEDQPGGTLVEWWESWNDLPAGFGGGTYNRAFCSDYEVITEEV